MAEVWQPETCHVVVGRMDQTRRSEGERLNQPSRDLGDDVVTERVVGSGWASPDAKTAG